MACARTHTCVRSQVHTQKTRTECSPIAEIDLTRSGLAQMRMPVFEHSRRTALSKDSRKSMALSCMALSNPTLPETLKVHGWAGVARPHTHEHTRTHIVFCARKKALSVYKGFTLGFSSPETQKSLISCISFLFIFCDSNTTNHLLHKGSGKSSF